ncbi:MULTISPECIES: efflux RND transporter periplasmic adaptor subunit [Candidatus Ichthyocystis]|uniref:Putative exporter, AcrA family n=1 Tax=Candidatus Ichthyocystis hellenicum TaxID=1561003 RepID=A0A0S4M0Q5_9BURK|nr:MULTISPECIES: efflux RND transporter periplasmic adaptor subunit [Ichthyocystis]CUT17385.1 putative exporter, AcrA family [Candidatus Ichthyocystis hellenicum]
MQHGVIYSLLYVVRRLRVVPFALPLLFMASCVSDEAHKVNHELRPGYSTEYPVEFLRDDLDYVDYRDVGDYIPVIGSIISSNKIDLSTEQPGTLFKVVFKKGDFVHKGSLLASLDKGVLLHKRDQASSQYDVGVSMLSLAQKDFFNSQQLHQKGFVSDLEFETAKAGLQQKKAQLALYKAQYEEIIDQLKDADLYSPITGYVSEAYVNTGQSVVAGQKLCSLLDLSHLEASLMIPTEKILHVHVKTPVKLFVGDQKVPINSFVSRISPESSADSHTFIVFSPVPNQNDVFKVGMFVKGFLVTSVHRKVIAVPEAAIREDSNRKFVYLIRDNKIIKQYVDVGLIDKVYGYFEVLSGLRKGDTIVMKNFGSLAQGTHVKVVDLIKNQTDQSVR